MAVYIVSALIIVRVARRGMALSMLKPLSEFVLVLVLVLATELLLLLLLLLLLVLRASTNCTASIPSFSRLRCS